MPAWSTPKGADPDAVALLDNIKAVLGGNEASLSVVLTDLNRSIAQMVQENQGIVNKVTGNIIKRAAKLATANANALDPIEVAILQRMLDYSQSNEFLLTQLTAAAGLTQPGEPLEAALIDRSLEAPDIAYSAALLMALREALGPVSKIAYQLERIADSLAKGVVAKLGEDVGEDAEPDPDPDSGDTANDGDEPVTYWSNV